MVGPAALLRRCTLSSGGLEWSAGSKVIVEPVSLLSCIKSWKRERGERGVERGEEIGKREEG